MEKLQFLLFRAPGRAISWVQYMWPRHGEVWSSKRRLGNPTVEVVYSILFWLGLAFLIFLATRTKNG